MGLNDALEIVPLVRSVAKRLGFGMAAAAKAKRRASAQAEGLAFLIDHLEIAFDAVANHRSEL